MNKNILFKEGSIIEYRCLIWWILFYFSNHFLIISKIYDIQENIYLNKLSKNLKMLLNWPDFYLYHIWCLCKIHTKTLKNSWFRSFFSLLNQKHSQIFQKVLRFRIQYFICWKLWILRLFMHIFRLIGPKFHEIS